MPATTILGLHKSEPFFGDLLIIFASCSLSCSRENTLCGSVFEMWPIRKLSQIKKNYLYFIRMYMVPLPELSDLTTCLPEQLIYNLSEKKV